METLMRLILVLLFVAVVCCTLKYGEQIVTLSRTGEKVSNKLFYLTAFLWIVLAMYYITFFNPVFTLK